ncbi:hypothetical protein JXE04_01745 [Patescibacteria group bacterium]|nr:hypothetical protein [Patescibacteria group bacterium]
MLSRTNLQKIHALAIKSESLWPKSLRSDLQIYWQKTLYDDKHGLISSLSLDLLREFNSTTKTLTKLAYRLGVAELYFWTAANLEDDLSDDNKTPKNYLPLLSFCRDLAWKYIYQAPSPQNKTNNKTTIKLIGQCHAANFKEINTENNIPNEALSAANKSIFLLIGPMILINQLNWPKNDQNNFLLAGKYFLAAKQLADDIYDYREDWCSKKYSFAHYGLNQLPQGPELSIYFKKQANNILSLCRLSRKQLKKVVTLKKHNYFNDQLNILENNCHLSLSKISLEANKA